ncbi:MAG TPA: CHAT domain-containing protein, partial [Thermoanaerobaculia bacterium]
MDKIKVLLFAADPLSVPPYREDRLLLDEEVRRYRRVVRASANPDAVVFDLQLASRTDDLLQALNESSPQVVHFSGHGGEDGLVLVGADGHGTRCVDAEALGELFQLFRDDVRVVVLNACLSLPQAEAIAEAVGCAIGTPHKISDRAAITFGKSFYRAIAFGKSVQVAYNQACSALSMEKFSPKERPRLVVRAGVDASQIILVPPRGAPAAAPEPEAP